MRKNILIGFLVCLTGLPLCESYFTATSSLRSSSHHHHHAVIPSSTSSTSFLVQPLWRKSNSMKATTTTTTAAAAVSHKRRQQPSQSRSRSNLSMHMGHSHNHEHAMNGDTASTASSTAAASKSTRRFRRRRLYAMVLFCAVAILGPPLFVKKQALAQTDVAAFGVTCIALSLLEPMRNQVQSFVRKVSLLGHGIAKHSTPLTAQYFFKNESAADRVTLLGGVVNIILSAGKFFVGVHCHSSALIADAGHSLSDLFSDFVTLWAVQVGRLPPDEDHPYGHGKFEAIGSLFLSLTLFGTGIGVGIMSNRKLLEILALQKSGGIDMATAVPGIPALFMAGMSVLSKEWLFRVTASVGQRLNSQIVLANAWHHRSDAYSSILALVSIGLARFSGLLAADAVAGLLVAGMICMTGAEIMGESIKQLTDASHVELEQTVTALALSAMPDDVERVLSVKARHMGSSSTVDVSVAMPNDRTASAARTVEARLKQSILEHYHNENEGSSMHVDVRATSPGMTCPLLTAPTAAQVEKSVRSTLADNTIVAVQDVTVHYPDPMVVNVDVDITLLETESSMTIAKAQSMAHDISTTLQTLTHIDEANIYLDLLHSPATTMTTTTEVVAVPKTTKTP